MSGESGAKAPELKLNEIRFHGTKGKFLYIDVLGGKTEEGKDGKKKYKTTEIPGSKIEVVFLKVRRKLSQFRKGKKSLNTNEHNHKDQRVVLFGGDKPESGIASDLREKYQGLRTQQVIYCLYEGELVRLTLRGASLGSETKDKKEFDFYSYISSFKSDGKEEHFYDFVTILSPLEEEGPQGTYYCVGYKRGEELSKEMQDKAGDEMYRAFDYCKKVDDYYATQFKARSAPKKEAGEDQSGEDDGEGIDYPKDEINPEDIPF